MVATQSIPKVTEEEHLKLERAAEFRHEFVGGEIFARAVGTLRQSLLAASWMAALSSQVRRGDCSVFHLKPEFALLMARLCIRTYQWCVGRLRSTGMVQTR